MEEKNKFKFHFVVVLTYNFSIIKNIITSFLKLNKDSKGSFIVSFYLDRRYYNVDEIINHLKKVDFSYKLIFTFYSANNESRCFNKGLEEELGEYTIFINDEISFESDYINHLLHLVNDKPNEELIGYSFYRQIQKKKKTIYKKHLLKAEFTSLKAIKHLLYNTHKIYPYIFLYLFKTDYIINNKIRFDELVEKDNEFSFLLKAFYYAEKVTFVDSFYVIFKPSKVQSYLVEQDELDKLLENKEKEETSFEADDKINQNKKAENLVNNDITEKSINIKSSDQRLVFSNKDIVNIKTDSVSKIYYKFNSIMMNKFDVIYVFKLFLSDKHDFELYKPIFTSIRFYTRLFFTLIKDELLNKKFNIIQIIFFFIKRSIYLSSSYYQYYGGSYTKLIENNKLLVNYQNTYDRKVRFTFIIKYEDMLNNDFNKSFFKNLLNSKNHKYEVYIFYKKNEKILLEKSISYFIKKYDLIFKLFEYENFSLSVKELIQVLKSEYVIFGTNNCIYSNKFTDILTKYIYKENYPSIISVSFQEYNYTKNLNYRVTMQYFHSIGEITKNKLYKQFDTTLYNKVINLEFLKNVLSDQNVNSTLTINSPSMQDSLFFLLILYSKASKVISLKENLISLQFVFNRYEEDLAMLHDYKYYLKNKYEKYEINYYQLASFVLDYRKTIDYILRYSYSKNYTYKYLIKSFSKYSYKIYIKHLFKKIKTRIKCQKALKNYLYFDKNDIYSYTYVHSEELDYEKELQTIYSIIYSFENNKK